MTTHNNDALERAISCFNSQKEMASRLAKLAGGRDATMTPMAISWWKHRGVPAKWCRHIEDATDGRVRCCELRPDIFPRDAA